MAPAEARLLLLRFDGRPRHAGRAGLTAREAIALRLRADGIADLVACEWLDCGPTGLARLLGTARQKLVEWHRATAKDTLAVVENRSVIERATYEDPRTGLAVEIRPSQSAEDHAARAHPELKPDVSTLVAPTLAALSAILD